MIQDNLSRILLRTAVAIFLIAAAIRIVNARGTGYKLIAE